MFRLIIKQGYDKVAFEFATSKEAAAFMDAAINVASGEDGEETNFILEYTQPGKTESEVE